MSLRHYAAYCFMKMSYRPPNNTAAYIHVNVLTHQSRVNKGSISFSGPILTHNLIMLTCMAYNFRYMFFACTVSRRCYVILCSTSGFRLDIKKEKSPLWCCSDITWATWSIKSPATRYVFKTLLLRLSLPHMGPFRELRLTHIIA